MARLRPPKNPDPLALPRAQRRARGVYYTPPEIVREVVAKTLHDMDVPSRVLDPACGAGAMLIEAQRPGVSLFGIDCDRAAVQIARRATRGEVWSGDALFDQRLEKLAPFDAIVANPPYVNIRQLAKSHTPEYIERLRRRFRTARGNFDLYVVFLERALALLRPGGRCGMIIPNKWATLDYARPLRELLLAETTIEEVVDLSSQRVFAEASVYPHIVVLSKSRPRRRHAVLVTLGGRGSRRAATLHGDRIPQHVWSVEGVRLVSGIDVESRLRTRSLGDLCSLSCGTPGYSAQRVAAALRNATEDVPCSAKALEFITSGNIDRYAIRLGDVRFLGRTYERPELPLDSPALTERKRTLFAGPKIVIAGLSQRLEAAWDDCGLALGVQVFAASEFQVDPQYLLALLNSKLLTYLFRTRFSAKRLAGGYMAINKGQLARLPIVLPRRTSVSLVLPGQARRLSYDDDAAIDQAVYRLYRLTKAEIAEVESHFAKLGRRAA